jgi:transposase
MVDEALKTMSSRFDEIYPEDGRKSIPPERLLRALLLQMLYSVRSERMLREQMEHNLLFRWFVGLSANEPVWHPTVFTKNRDRLLEGAARLYKKSSGSEAKLGYLGHVITENRNG